MMLGNMALSMMMVSLKRQVFEAILQEGRNRFIGIGFTGNDGLYALLHQALVETAAHAAGDQNIDLCQWFDHFMMAGVEALIDGQFDQFLVGQLALIELIYPEISAFPGMPGNAFAILAGDGNFHHFLPLVLFVAANNQARIAQILVWRHF